MRHIFATTDDQPQATHLEVSEADQAATVAALRATGHRVVVLDEQERARYAEMTRQLAELHPDLVV